VAALARRDDGGQFVRVSHTEGGKAHGYSKDNPPKLHRFQLIDGGFAQLAIPTTRRVVERRMG
jgi:hypothetical protein